MRLIFNTSSLHLLRKLTQPSSPALSLDYIGRLVVQFLSLLHQEVWLSREVNVLHILASGSVPDFAATLLLQALLSVSEHFFVLLLATPSLLLVVEFGNCSFQLLLEATLSHDLILLGRLLIVYVHDSV